MNSDEKVIIVTGASKGLGLGLSKALLARGYRVAVCSRKSSQELEELLSGSSGRLFWNACTIGEPDQEELFISSVVEWCGSKNLYGLVNNAAIAGEGILATFPIIDIENIFQINLIGAMRLSRLALRHMLRHRGAGRIINISSIVGRSGYTGLTAYSASKAGMDAMTRSLAREVGRASITVNSVAPGYLLTELSSSLGAEQRRQILRRTPLGRLGDVEDVTPVISFLLSEEARFVTGQTIVVDGGTTC